MNTIQKKIVAAVLIAVLLFLGAVLVGKGMGMNLGTFLDRKKQFDLAAASTEAAAEVSVAANYDEAVADLIFWYEDETYAEFLDAAAKSYFARTGVKVALECQDTIDYVGDIYERTMQDDGFPDVYLISGDNLEEAYLYGLVSVNKNGTENNGIAQNAIKASTYGEKYLGYPLSYNTCVFIYQSGYFETEPQSIQAIIDYSDENEPGENVEYLLEWDVNDAFYDFPFISNSVIFEKTQAECMEVVYDEDLYEQDLAFFEGILESFSIDAETVSEENIVENFLEGKTLCAIVDTDSLHRLEGYSYSVMEIPDLNDSLEADSCAITDMLLVNEFSMQGDVAADFAKFVTVDMAAELYELSGHFSVIPSEEPGKTENVAYQVYEASVLVPDSQDAKSFWVKLEETISKYF